MILKLADFVALAALSLAPAGAVAAQDSAQNGSRAVVDAGSVASELATAGVQSAAVVAVLPASGVAAGPVAVGGSAVVGGAASVGAGMGVSNAAADSAGFATTPLPVDRTVIVAQPVPKLPYAAQSPAAAAGPPK